VRVLLLSGAVLLTDQATKLLVKGLSVPWLGIEWRGMTPGASRPLLGDFFRLTFIENPGMAFGIDLGGKLFFSIVSFIATLGILFYLYRVRTERLGFRVALALILGGAAGNLIDRAFYGLLYGEGPLFYGKVVDFLDVEFFNLSLFGYHLSRWPVFNIADASVTVGVLLLLVFSRLQEEPAPQESGAPSATVAAEETAPPDTLR
jgi:signal peptidase II